MTPALLRYGFMDLQVCVPADFTEAQVREFAESAAPCGTDQGWQIRRDGDPALNGDPERQPCGSRTGRVHVVLDA